MKAKDKRVCFKIDDYIEDRDRAIWIAKLSNGETVYQDEDRYGPSDYAWFRLRNYCKSKKIKIDSIVIKFRSHTEKIIDNDGEGVFFRNKALAGFSNPTHFYFLFGVIKDGIIKVDHWMVPELIFEETDERPVDGHEESIIWNPKVKK